MNRLTPPSTPLQDPGISGHPRGTVLLVANYAPDVGFAWWLMENFWVQFAREATRQRLGPLIAYPIAGTVPQPIQAEGIETIVHGIPGSDLRGLIGTLRLVRARRVRCVYLTDRKFTSPTYLLLRLAGVRVLINHDHVPGDRRPATGLSGILRAVWRRMPGLSCDLQICVSPLIRERAIASARIPGTKTAVVQNGIEPIDCSGDRSYVRRVLGLPQDSLVCINVGRAHPNKRIPFVVEVARRCVHELRLDNLYFVHCGDGPEMDRLRALVERGGLKGRFVLAGRRSDVAELLCSADAALHPARGEAFSLAILEYMSAGLAVLVPDVPTVRQAIRHDDTGLIFPEGDVEEACKLLKQVCTDPDRRARLGKAAAEEVRTRYSLEQMNETFRSVINSALGSLPTPHSSP